MKTRSSSGVGQKIDLDFNVDTLRIADAPDDGEQRDNKKRGNMIFDSIKPRSTVTEASRPLDPAPKVTADVQSSKLKQMLAQIKSTS